MAVVISRDYVLSSPTSSGDTETNDNPIIGYRNIINSSNIVSDFANSSFPVSNLVNPATNLKWKSTVASLQYITITPTINAIDYVAIARHNLATSFTPISIEGFDGVTWSELVSPVILADDRPAIFRFPLQSLLQVRIKLDVGFDIPFISVVYCGELLVLQRRIYVGHIPIPFGREDNIVNGKSESGEFLGRIVLGSSVSNAVSLKNITPLWYRAYLDPFIVSSKTIPFFFAWRPMTYPEEVGYAWITNNPKAVNQSVNGFMSIDLQLSGVS
jgi:hypothetical protein